MNAAKLNPLLVLLLAAFALLAPARAQTPRDSGLHARERYALRAGDTVTLEYRFTPEYNQTVTLQPDGFVTLDLVGSVYLAGLTLDQARALIVERASTTLNRPELNVTLKDFEHPYIVVAGEVEKPGRFDFYEKTTALQAVLLAGGFKGSAKQSAIYVFRKVDGGLAEVHKIDLHKVRSARDLERDLVLEPGDMILVPANKLENIGRFVKAINLGLYFNPLSSY